MVCTVTSCSASAPVVYKSACIAVCPNQYYSLKKNSCKLDSLQTFGPRPDPVYGSLPMHAMLGHWCELMPRQRGRNLVRDSSEVYLSAEADLVSLRSSVSGATAFLAESVSRVQSGGPSEVPAFPTMLSFSLSPCGPQHFSQF